MSKLIGIVGTSYCGSTLLSLILGSHKSIFATSELNTLLRQRENTRCSVCGSNCVFWTKTFIRDLLNNIKERYFWVTEKAQNNFNTSITVFSDKNPSVYIASPIKCDLYITLFKQPEAFVNSYLIHDKPKTLNTPLELYTDTYSRAVKMENNCYICYQDFANNPEKITKYLCKKLDIEYTSSMLEFWKTNHHTLGGNSGVHMHIWNDKKRKKIIESNYWENVYSKEHTKFVKKYYRQIKLDEKWKKQLTKEQKEYIKNDKKSQEMYKKMLQLREY